jgi:hypothetical protein
VPELDPSKSRLKMPSESVANPRGLNQTTERLSDAQQMYESGASRLRPWQPQSSMLETARSWYTGANSQSMENGWSTPFYQKAFEQYGQWQDRAKQAERASVFYDWLDPAKNPQATGVATWGAAPEDEEAKQRGDMRFGDVFDNGRKVGNVYDDHPGDRATADVLMGEFFYDKQQKAEWFRNPERQSIYREENERRRRENTDRALYSKGAEDYDRNVKDREREIREGQGNEALWLTNVAASATTGAGAGALLTSWLGPGAAVGAVAGGIIGGVAGAVGGWLNQDQQIEMAARSMEQADIASRKFDDNWFAKATMNVGEISAMGTKMLSPVSNIVQGLEDARLGKVGDMTADFYEVDDEGNRKVNNWGKAADLAATLTDGILKWASPVGVWMDLATMGGVSLGKVGELTTGTVFNDRRGDFDKLENGTEWAGAVGSASIDLVQLGIAGGFAKATRASREAFTGTADVGDAAKATGMLGGSGTAGKLDQAYGKARGLNLEGAQVVESTGMRFFKDEAGDVIGSRVALSMLAPSEWLRWIPAGYQARKLAAMDAGAVTREHMLKASLELGTNSMFRNAVLMGYSEGGEEFVQAWMEPLSTGDRASWGQAFEAYMYGAAGGAGMALGPRSKVATSKQVLEMQAYVQHTLRMGGKPPTQEEWKAFTKGWSAKDFEKVARGDEESAEKANAALSHIAGQQRQASSRHSSIGYFKTEAIKMDQFEKLQRKALEEGNGSLVLLGQTGEYLYTPNGRAERAKFPANSGVMSLTEAMNQIFQRYEGFINQMKTANIEQAQFAQQVKADPNDETAKANLQAANDRLADLTNQVKVAKVVRNELKKFHDRAMAGANEAEVTKAIDALNEMILRAHRGQFGIQKGVPPTEQEQEYIRRAVEVTLGRHPFQDRGSFAIVIPQISLELTRMNAQGTMYIPQGMLKALGADHDGDTTIPQHDVYHTPEDLDRLRAGDQYMEPVQDENKHVSYKVKIDVPDTEWQTAATFHDYSRNRSSTTFITVSAAMGKLTNQIQAEFGATTGGPLPDVHLRSRLQKFREDVYAGKVDARETLINDMMNMDYSAFRSHKNLEHVPNVQWLWSKINESFDILQKDLAHGRATTATGVTISEQQEKAETTIRDEIARVDAANASANLGVLGASDAVRGAQYLHYSALFRSLVEFSGTRGDTMTSDKQFDLMKLFMELGSGQQMSDLELITGANAVEERVYFWLQKMANGAKDTSRSTPETMLLLANMAVPSAELVTGTTNQYVVDKGSITLLQLLLRRSVDIAMQENDAAAPDSDIAKKLKRLRQLTYRDPDPAKRSDTPSLAMLEVMGNRPLYELVGKSSAFISPHITLNQLVESQRGLSSDDRSEQINLMKHVAAYIKDPKREFKDPPWPMSAMAARSPEDVPISAYALVVDALQAAGNAYFPKLKSRNDTVQKNFIDGLTGIQNILKAFRLANGDALSKNNSEVTNRQILRAILESDPGLAQKIATIIPDAAALGVFQIHPDGTVTASTWLEDMLVEENVERAAAMYYFNVKIAEWLVMAGTVDTKRMRELKEDPEGFALEDIRGRIDPDRLTSRFHQVMYSLASQNDSIQLLRFLTAMDEAPSIDAMFKQINEQEPSWLGNQQALLPWYDEVGDFQVNPEDTWVVSQGATFREGIAKWSKSMQVRGSIAIEQQIAHEHDMTLIAAMQEYAADNTQDRHGAKEMYGLLDQALRNRRLFPDYEGQAVKDQLLELQQVGLAQVQNKGAADDKAAPFGNAAITLDSMGYANAARQELNALTSEDIEDFQTNVTQAVFGPIRLGYVDGSHSIFDLSTPEQALKMLAHPLLNGLARAVIFQTVRDVNNDNVLTHYQDTNAKTDNEGKGLLQSMLREQTHKHLFQQRAEQSERLKQAWTYLGLLESNVRQQVIDRGSSTDPTFRPIQQALHHFLTIFTHSKDSPISPELMRDQLVIDLADAIKAVASVDPNNRQRLQEAVIARMMERYEGNGAPLQALFNSLGSGQWLDQLVSNLDEDKAYNDAIDDFNARLSAATPGTPEYTAIKAEQAEYQETAERRYGAGHSHMTFRNATSALAMFEVADLNDETSMTNILDYLGAQNRIHRAHNKANQGLYNKALKAVYNDRSAYMDRLELSEWRELASWAAQLYLEDTNTRAGSHLPISGSLIGDDLETHQKYHDQSFSSATDILFDPRILEASRMLNKDGAHDRVRQVEEVVDYLNDGLLSPKRIGKWTPVIFNEMLKTDMVLKNSPVEAMVQMEGSDPVEMADYIGLVSWLRPDPSDVAMTTAELIGAPGQGLFDVITDIRQQVKLHNHFVTALVIEKPDGSPLDAGHRDLLLKTTHVNHTSADTVTAGEFTPPPLLVTGPAPSESGLLRVLDLEKLEAEVKWLDQAGLLTGGYKITVRYVDVDKKPQDRAHANNVYFDGVGREAVGGSSMGAIASLFFGLGALNKVGQQNPLDAATKKGKSFRPWKRVPLSDVLAIEGGGKSVSEVIALKVQHMMAQKFPMGELQYADMPSIYKLLKMRHVVVGYDANGDKQVMWAEEAINHEALGQQIPLDNWTLVPLTDSQAQTLWGKSGKVGVKGTAGSLIRPTFNVADMDVRPALDAASLEKIGLTRLGEERTSLDEMANSPLGAMTMLPRAIATADRGKTYTSLTRRLVTQWRGEQLEVHTARQDKTKGPNAPGFQSKHENQQALIDMLDLEFDNLTSAKLGIPTQGIADLAALEVARSMAAQIDRMMSNPNSILWRYKHNQTSNVLNGTLGYADVPNNFGKMGSRGPVFEDYVIIDLHEIQNSTDVRNMEHALEVAREVVTTLSRKGVSIVLTASGANVELRQALVEDLNDGSLGYRSMNDSNIFFTPITEDQDLNAAQRAIQSTLLETNQIGTHNVALRLVTDDISTSLTEATEWVDVEHDRSYNVVSHTVLPANMMGSRSRFSRRNTFAFGIPQRGTGKNDQLGRVNAELRKLLEDPEGVKYLKKLLGPENDYPKYDDTSPTGIIKHGVLTIDQAIENLRIQVLAGNHALDKGETFYWGTVVPVVSGDGSIHLQRVGFKPPTHKEMAEKQKLRFKDQPMTKFTAATDKLDGNQTLPPPTIIDEIRYTRKGISLLGTYKPGRYSKLISEGIGLKSGLAPMPPGYTFPDAAIGSLVGAGQRVTRIMGSTSVVGKEARRGMVNNFRDGFAVTGINFEDDMINYFFGVNPNRDAATRADLLNDTMMVLKEWARQRPIYSAAEISRMLDSKSLLIAMEGQINAIGSSMLPSSWKPVQMRIPADQMAPHERIGQVILASLMAPGVRVEHVMGTQGVTTVTSHDNTGSNAALVRFMPALLTDALSDVAYPQVRTELIARMNRNMPLHPNPDPDPKKRKTHLMWFDNELNFHMLMQQEYAPGKSREEEVIGRLQLHLPLPADENSLRLTYSGIDSSGELSQHVADVTAGATGGRLMPKRSETKDKNKKAVPDALDELYGQNEIERFENEDDAAERFFHSMIRLREGGDHFNPWQLRTPMEAEHLVEAAAKMRQYFYRGKRDKDTGWKKGQRAEADRLGMEFLGMLNIRDESALPEVEALLRQLWGIPGPAKDQKKYKDHLSFELYQAGIEYMKRNVKDGMNPIDGGAVPLPSMAFWRWVLAAQQNLEPDARWMPLKNGNKKGKAFASIEWGEWVDVIMGQVRASEKSFDAMFSTDLDGFYNTYQGTHPDYMDMAVTMDQQRQAKLIDQNTNRPFISINPGRDAVLRDPIVLASQHMTYSALVGKGAVTMLTEADNASASAVGMRKAAIEAWQRSEKLPKQKDMSVKEYAKMGAQYRESQRTTSNAMRNLVNASVALRLFNPALYFSAMVEIPFRNSLEGATNILTGQLSGRRGMAVAAGVDWMEQTLNSMLGEEKAATLGVTQRFSREEIATLNDLNKSMGVSTKFLGEIYAELVYQSVIGDGQGKIGARLEGAAAAAARMTADPKWGMKATKLAQRYNDAVWEYLSMTNSQITMDQYNYYMGLDPLWLASEDPRAHQMGLNAVQQARGAKETLTSRVIMSPISRMTSSENGFVNGSGHLLKLPFMFTRFNANMFLTLTGLSGMDQAVAMFFGGRQSNWLTSARASSKKEQDTEPTYWDTDTIIESLDLSRSFVRGAVTQTGLMAMGMLAGGFSLGGEDEEERKRKRLATYLNTPYYHDPRKASNDFRWKDAIFLDNVPVLSALFKDETGHSAVVPHWIIRQFSSPVIGMMRFFETGDVGDLVHGFADAATVVPTSFLTLVRQTAETQQLLAETAEDDELIVEKMNGTSQLFTNIVFLYERMLLESAFVNSLYQAVDDFDRNPWAIQATDETGNIIYEQGTGNAVQTEALQQFQDETTEGNPYIKGGYAQRKNRDALMHQYAEGNATAALMLSILPWVQGKDSTYLRGNMVTKKQRVNLDETPTEKMEALVFSTYLGMGAQDSFTKEEIIGAIKQRYQAADIRWEQSAVEAEADEIYSTIKDRPLSIIVDNHEELTLDGKEGIFTSLAAGAIKLDDPAIAGFHMTYPERDELAERITTDLVQEGVDFGLSEQSAMYRMRRIWFGDSTNPSAPGLREILYDKRIPDKPYVEYDQLNVTYVMGPDGKPWATPFQRQKVLGALGLPVPHTIAPTIEGQTTLDQRGNVIDLVNGINTGLAAVQPRPIQPPEDQPVKDPAVDAAEKKTYSIGGGRWRRGGFGRGGYGGSSYGPNFQRMDRLPYGDSPRINTPPMINTSNPIIRRADVRRERISSERGRLKQWQ